MGRAGVNLAAGALAGYVASRTMDAATTWFYGRQSDGSKKREDEIAPGGTLVQLGKQLGGVVGRDLDDAQAGRIGLAVHRSLGVLYGIAATRLVHRGVAPLAAGVVVGTAGFVLLDEGTAIGQVFDYPVESHLRGVVGHATLGLSIGTFLELLGRA
jgi:hypothetical protein